MATNPLTGITEQEPEGFDVQSLRRRRLQSGLLSLAQAQEPEPAEASLSKPPLGGGEISRPPELEEPAPLSTEAIPRISAFQVGTPVLGPGERVGASVEEFGRGELTGQEALAPFRQMSPQARTQALMGFFRPEAQEQPAGWSPERKAVESAKMAAGKTRQFLGATGGTDLGFDTTLPASLAFTEGGALGLNPANFSLSGPDQAAPFTAADFGIKGFGEGGTSIADTLDTSLPSFGFDLGPDFASALGPGFEATGGELAAQLGAQGLGDVGDIAAAGLEGLGDAVPFVGRAISLANFFANVGKDPGMAFGNLLTGGLAGLFRGLFGGHHTKGSTIHLPGVAPEGVKTNTLGGTQTVYKSYGEGVGAEKPFATAISQANTPEEFLAALNQPWSPHPGQFRVESHGPVGDFMNLGGTPFAPSWSPWTLAALQNPDVIKNLGVQAGMLGAPADQPALADFLRGNLARLARG